MQPHSNASGTDGGPGGIAFSDSAPGGFRFLSPCRKEQRDSYKLLGNGHNPRVRRGNQHGNVLISRLNGTVTRWLPQSLTRQLPPGGSRCVR